MIPWWSTDFGEPEIARVSEAIRNRHISQGPVTRQFEEALAERLGVPYVVCTTSGTTALTMALMACGIGSGDHVIVPNRTWIATAHAVMMAGAEVTLADVGPRGVLDDTFDKATAPVEVLNNPHDASAPSPRTFRRVTVSVDRDADKHSPLLVRWLDDEPQEVSPDAWDALRAYTAHGMRDNTSAAVDPIVSRISNKKSFGPWLHCSTETHPKAVIPVHLNGRFAYVPRDRLVIEDACQAFPKKPEGVAACYSMSTAKLLPTGQGGFVATSDEGLYRELKAIRTHDVEDAMVPKVLTWKRWGYNFRYNDILASIGIAQLGRLQDRIERLLEIQAVYAESLPIEIADGVPLYAELLHPEPERLRAHLFEHGIEARPFYPSLHTAPYLKATGEFPNSEKWSKGLILPSGPCQRLSDIRRVCQVINDFR